MEVTVLLFSICVALFAFCGSVYLSRHPAVVSVVNSVFRQAIVNPEVRSLVSHVLDSTPEGRILEALTESKEVQVGLDLFEEISGDSELSLKSM